MMTVIEFLGIAAGVAILVLLIAFTLEKLTSLFTSRLFGRRTQITASLVLTLALFGGIAMVAGQWVPLCVALLVGMAILLNRYWMGHFSEDRN